MELKDYLHLYIGCKAIVSKGEDGKLIRDFIGLHSNWSYPVILEIGGHISSEIPENIKLILRPLSDMTEAEAWECWHLTGYHNPRQRHVSNPKCALTDTTFHAKMEPKYWFIATKYLLSKHFDLFGLIPKGLAIDSTTFKETIK